MIGLGIESTAHTFGVGITDENLKNLANIQKIYHPEEGGIHPREATQHHLEIADKAVNEAISRANIKLKDLNYIAFSQGPGLTN
jgi:tRNA A37 threonylcarbamoyltransferase TsaD